MIKFYNGTKLMRQPFFLELINYLNQKTDVTLRQIRAHFPEVQKLDRALEDYIQAGFIKRADRRYSNAFSLLTETYGLNLDSPVFVEVDSPLDAALHALTYSTELSNSTNAAILRETVDFPRENLSLSNYFYRCQQQLPMSSQLAPLYDLLGDVNQEYALKYMTTFLIKFAKRDQVPQKQPDIFVQALDVLGYIKQVQPQRYVLNMDLDTQTFIFTAY